MRKFFKKKAVWLTAAAVLVIGCVSVGPAMAYFTTYTSAAGSQVISLGAQTKIEEPKVENWTKHIDIKNTGTNDCYVRVKAFCGDQFTIDYTDESGNWETRNNDGYWYYKPVVAPNATTSQLLAKINVPENLKSSFNVVVVQECTGVLYDTNGQPYADWTQVIDTTTGISEGGSGN